MPNVFVTGANRGLGLEFTRQYAAEGWRVLAACRTPKSADALTQVGGRVEIMALDVADNAAVAALGKSLADESLDLLINNAGVLAVENGIDGVDLGLWERHLAVNAIAPFAVTRALLPALRRGREKKVVMISSLMGSVADNATGGYYIYRSGKAALNMVCKTLALDLRAEGIMVNPLHPGWVRTDMGGPEAMLEPPAAVKGLRRVIAGLQLANTGRFYSFEGKELPW